MTGLARRTGLSIRLIRTGLEVTVLVIGWLLGGVVGVGTVLYALLIGPAVQAFLPLVTVRVTPPARPARGESDHSAIDGQGERQDAVDTRAAEPRDQRR